MESNHALRGQSPGPAPAELPNEKHMPAEYECLWCGEKHADKEPMGSSCPHCGHIYVKWVNYEAWRKDWHKRHPEMKPY